MTDNQNKRIVMVLGAGRTGTSLLMQVLYRLGMTVSEEMTPPSEQNQMGGYEDSDVFSIQSEILEILETNRMIPLPDNWLENPAINIKKKQLAKIIESKIVNSPTILGIKDPRIALLLPLWVQIFNHLKIVPIYLLAVRDPVATVCSLKKQYNSGESISELFWLHKNCSALTHTGSNCYIVHYEDWFTRPNELAQELLEYTGLDQHFTGKMDEVFKEVIKPHLNRSVHEDYQLQNEYVSKLYGRLKNCRGDRFDRTGLMAVVKECRKAIEGFKGWYLETQKYIGKQAMLRQNGQALKAKLKKECQRAEVLAKEVEKERQRADGLAEKMKKMRQKVQAYELIKNSLSYKIGNTMVIAIKKPGWKTVRFPYDMVKVFVDAFSNFSKRETKDEKYNIQKTKQSKNRISKNGQVGPVNKNSLDKLNNVSVPELSSSHNNQHAPVIGKDLRNRTQYIQNGREDHVFRLFNEFRAYRQFKNSMLRIACIVSRRLLTCLEFEAELIALPYDNWNEVLEESKPDFLLVQSCIEKSESWQKSIASPAGPPDNLLGLINYCKKKNIPTVFWDTEDHVHLPLFLKTAPLFDRIFASDPRSVDVYGKSMNIDVVQLGPAVQPALHNPLRRKNEKFNGFTFLFDGWADILEYPASFDYLKPMLAEGLHIVESRYKMRANKLNDLPEFRENVMGCVSYDRLLTALRHYKIIFITDQSLSSHVTHSWKALEALACGCRVILYGKQTIQLPEELVVRAEDALTLKEKAFQLIDDQIGSLRFLQKARREIYASHTYAHRIKTICESLNIRHDWEAHPLVSVILPTKRPEMIEACIEKYNKQTYPRKELIIVVNTTDVDMNNVNRITFDYPDVKVFQVHQEKNIGICLNLGIDQAKGKYWFKMDDDDFYGANYLTDLVHLSMCADFHVIGKPTGFIYLEDHDKVYLRHKAIKFQHAIGSTNMPDLCGATLGGKRDLFTGFSECHRACVDTGFAEGNKVNNRILLSGDFWNFIAFRAKEKHTHTWRLDDNDIKKNASSFDAGSNFDQIMV